MKVSEFVENHLRYIPGVFSWRLQRSLTRNFGGQSDQFNIEDLKFNDLRKIKDVGRLTLSFFAEEIKKIDPKLLHPSFDEFFYHQGPKHFGGSHTPDGLTLTFVKRDAIRKGRKVKKSFLIAKCKICGIEIRPVGWMGVK